MAKKILVLPGDYIGPEIMEEAVKVLREVDSRFGLDLQLEFGLLGGAAIDATGVPLPPETLATAKAADAILLGAVGGPKWDGVERHLRPERGLLGIRSELGLFGNLRPAILYPQLLGLCMGIKSKTLGIDLNRLNIGGISKYLDKG